MGKIERIVSLGDHLLAGLANGIEIIEYGRRRPGALLRYGLEHLREMDALRAQAKVRSTLCHLKKRGLAERIQRDQVRAYRLTAAGQARIAELSYTEPKKLANGKFLIVSFDIPETCRHARLALRRYLRSKKFRHLHRSVWISDRDRSEELIQYLRKADVGEWIEMYLGESILHKENKRK